MTNIYVVKYETVEAFTTARKLIEYVKTAFENWVPNIDNQAPVSINNIETSKLITILNKEGFIHLYSGSELVQLDKIKLN